MTTTRRYLVYLWLSSSTLAALLCLHELSATLVNGEYIPADQDSFYHARRILDSIEDPLSMYQFDRRIHSPEGSWITWPWGYDMAMAVLAHIYVALTGSTQPMELLAFVAPAWVFVNMGLILAIAREMSLAFSLQVFTLLFYALLPLTRSLHRVGMIDHHFVEYTFVLATVFFGLRFLGRPKDRWGGLQLGVTLGMAPAFHNGLFILQLPILATVLIMQSFGHKLPLQTTRSFALSLTVTSLAFLLPSEPFRLWMFSFYLQSWFHLYVACCTAVNVVLVSRLQSDRRTLIGLVILNAVLALPLISSMLIGGSWVSGTMPELQRILEVESPWHAVWVGRGTWIVSLYTFLIFVAPVGLIVYFLALRNSMSPERLFFGVFMVFGFVLLSNQIRLQYFGSLALALPWCVIVNDRLRRTKFSAVTLAGLGVLFFVALSLPVYSLIGKRTPPATDFQFTYSIDIFKVLRAVCQDHPGLVLADQNDGHIVTYYSDCSVLANNFIMTPQHQRKIREARELLTSTLSEVLEQRPDIEYILIRRADPVLYTRKQACGRTCAENTGLASELLFSDSPKSDMLRMLAESTILVESEQIPFVRLFAVVKDAAE